MVTLLLTCLLTAGSLFIPLEDWKIEKIVGGGKLTGNLIYVPPMMCSQGGLLTNCPEPDTRTRIYLSRTLNLGDVVQAPEGCTVEMRRE